MRGSEDDVAAILEESERQTGRPDCALAADFQYDGDVDPDCQDEVEDPLEFWRQLYARGPSRPPTGYTVYS